MPTSAFFNLSEEKRNKIIECSYDEFADNFYEKVSFLQIAKKANVSRASLYFYFKDKCDLYFYLFEQIISPFISEIKLTNDKIDLFECAKHLFDYLVNFENGNKKNFIKKALQNFDPKNQQIIINNLANKYQIKLDISNWQHINTEDVKMLGILVLSAIVMSLLKVYNTETSAKQATQTFDKTLEIFKYGILEERK